MITLKTLIPTVAVLMLCACSPVTAPETPVDTVAAPASDWIIKSSPYDVPTTVTRLTTAIKGAGAIVIAVVDHGANAARADLELPPTTVVIFGNPATGTPLMQADRRVALDLPQKVLVWQDGGTTRVGYLQPAALAACYDIDPTLPAISTMTGAMDRLTDAAIIP